MGQHRGHSGLILFIFLLQVYQGTALHVSMFVQGQPDAAAGIARQLLAHGARVDAQDKVGSLIFRLTFIVSFFFCADI